MQVNIQLEDGTVYSGESAVAIEPTLGEFVFNTSMTGYQEILTDPSYAGQIVIMTYPLIGNYGICEAVVESKKIQVSGFIVKEATSSLRTYLGDSQIPLIEGVDTRQLTKHIREKGSMLGGISISAISADSIKQYQMDESLIKQVSSRTIEHYVSPESMYTVGVLDMGCKNSIIKQLSLAGCSVIAFPYGTDSDVITSYNLDALLFSNGPGDPTYAKEAIELAKSLLGTLPLWGICLGHQVLSLALGAETYKLSYGHRGGNHPVMDLIYKKVLITSQNHGYGVVGESLPEGVRVSFQHVNDESVEGIQSSLYKMQSVQFHPEEGPGPEDAHYIINGWVDSLGEGVSVCH